MPSPRTRTSRHSAADTYQMSGVTVVELHGDIDVLTAPVVRAHLHDVTAYTGCVLLVDLRPVTFFDCSGLAVLVDAHQRTAAVGGCLAVVCDNALILDLMSWTQTRTLIQPTATLDQALAWLHPSAPSLQAG
ncbi:anti-sigma factor antagonist [Streptomyces rimosus]|uniref:anti-sigma factor antagonist n=1 Tax=Streptomyces rimosus TaxID=1927 RepID=UPI0037D1ECE7